MGNGPFLINNKYILCGKDQDCVWLYGRLYGRFKYKERGWERRNLGKKRTKMEAKESEEGGKFFALSKERNSKSRNTKEARGTQGNLGKSGKRKSKNTKEEQEHKVILVKENPGKRKRKHK